MVWSSSSREKKSATKRELGGAAAAGGMLGLALVGPVAGVLVGVTGAAVVSTTNGRVGKIARASGEAIASTGDQIQQWNEKYQIRSKTSEVVKSTSQRLKKEW
eukprot:CAMPEP_0194136158 /NCGR_PEP_ID=MMETSP0152-20130528/6178_1 /TAXON_ID=1049557 /ORGANISM="Thalassiothrix antarctica, Strain L6-D1" /LENGTH=102 /DNA_ID=CAMNT_0038832687 /DNA_START=91 /DNA_END=396 /DNA_ORIENTATION=-